MSRSAQSAAGYLLFILPAFALFTVFFIYPTASSMVYGFTDWNGYTSEFNFIGLDNFAKVFEDERFLAALRNTLLFALVCTVVQNALAVLLAVLLDLSIKGSNLLRTIYFLPVVLSPIVVSYVWSYIYSPLDGPLNAVLHALFGFPKDFPWLYDARTSLWAALAVQIWLSVGFAMAIYLAGLQGISREIYEAADIDGAGAWRRFANITFPLLAPAVTINLMLSMIGSMKQFDVVFGTTGGGPGYASETITTALVKSINGQDAGYGSALGIVLFVLLLIFSTAQLYVLRRREVDA